VVSLHKERKNVKTIYSTRINRVRQGVARYGKARRGTLKGRQRMKQNWYKALVVINIRIWVEEDLTVRTRNG